MQDYDVQVDDLVLFFADDQGNVVNRWVPKTVYANDRLAVPDSQIDAAVPDWRKVIVTEREADAAGPWYLTNLARLRPPPSTGTAIPLSELPGVPDAIQAAVAAGLTPKSQDIVVVPYTDAQPKGYLVPKQVYTACPVLPMDVVADLEFMAIEEGVVLANMPKFEVTGVSCYLLGLSNLRSGAAGLERAASEHAGAGGHEVENKTVFAHRQRAAAHNRRSAK